MHLKILQNRSSRPAGVFTHNTVMEERSLLPSLLPWLLGSRRTGSRQDYHISFFMCQRNCSECVSLLLRNEPTLEAKNEALVTAAKFGRDDYLCILIFPPPLPFANKSLALLLQNGADANAVEIAYQNPALLLACLRSCPSTAHSGFLSAYSYPSPTQRPSSCCWSTTPTLMPLTSREILPCTR